MSKQVFYIGSYTEMLSPSLGGSGKGIYTVELNNNTGKLTVLHTTFITNPGYLVKHQDYLYSVVEVLQEKQPKVVAYKIQEDFSLQLINKELVDGSLPCHINYTHNSLLVACYGTGNVLQFPIDTNGAILKNAANFYHQGNSINKERQEAPHAHQVAVHPDTTQVFVPDLGIDTLKSYRIENGILTKTPINDIEITKGFGPRHLCFQNSGDFGYLINELSGEVSIIKKEGNSFIVLDNIPSLPNSFNETPSASAIRIHPSLPILYVANRTLEAITIFKIQEDKLVFVTYQFLNGKTVREFNISPDGRWMIVCLMDSNDVYTFRILENGRLKQTFHTKEISSAVCVCF